MKDYKIIIIPSSKGSSYRKEGYNGIIFKTKLKNSKQYSIDLIRKFTETEKKLLEKEFNYDLDKNSDLKTLLYSIIEELDIKSVKCDLYLEELIPFCIPDNQILKFENL